MRNGGAVALGFERTAEGERRRSLVSTEENKAISLRVGEEIFNGGNIDLADELYAPDYVLHDPSLPEDLHAPKA